MRPGRILAGLVLVALGLLFLVHRLTEGRVDAGAIIADWWPLILIVAGGLQLAHSPRAWFAPTVVIVIGALLLAGNLEVVGAGLGIVWPLLLIAAGLRLVYRGAERRAAAERTPEGAVDAVVLFGERDVRPTGEFAGGAVSATFGGITVDLRGATIAPGVPVLAASAVFGGVDVIVPEGCRVRFVGFPIFGGARDATGGGDQEGPELEIRATAVFGRVEVRHRP